MKRGEAIAAFGAWCEASGRQATRRGIPDAWILGPGGLVAVKVFSRRRRRRYRLSRRRPLLVALAELGVPVVVWTPDDPVLRPMSHANEIGMKK